MTQAVTFQLSVHILDRYATVDKKFFYGVLEERAVLGAIFLIASKMYDIYPPTCSQMNEYYVELFDIDLMVVCIKALVECLISFSKRNTEC